MGKWHGIGQNDKVTRKVETIVSERFLNLRDYEKQQAETNDKVIYERELNSSNIYRVCIICPMSYKDNERETMEKQDDGTYKCIHCGLIKIPRQIWNSK